MTNAHLTSAGSSPLGASARLELTAEQTKAVWLVVDYLFHDESKDYWSYDVDDRHRHIFNVVKVLALACGYATPEQLQDIEDVEVQS